ncbi:MULTISPECIES: TnsA-like heteromeric transposase endonuclease subunit [Streptomyces]|uniref:TnsA-like heteromeric transposase endonuclease subunit n=1 Tax=Streptomyces dengpaensis TaxID=2049881 RepID=A0ABM6T3K6_9ACTN|nr:MULTISPECIES: TnsA-like heteromeric transposase endonuclease subunit [Streptomyces]AVH61693.1 TnsA-like heteromeric transposase endonuclease subunit [Streptomyces dengpaensis]PIB00247.1 hypothetical protein B1C81_38960 [Streptomyces sp. HG99]
MHGLAVEVAFTEEWGRFTQLPWDLAAGSVRFEELSPVSAFPVAPGGRRAPGWWWSATTGRHVVHGSVAMRTQLMVLDRDPEVTGLSARPARFLWRDPAGGGVRAWVPQLFARYADGTGLLADCPSSPTAGSELTQRARMVLEAACARVGWVYRSLEPPGAVRTANLRWLAGYRHPRHQGPSWLRSALAAVFAVPRPLGDGVALAGDPLQVLPALYHALWAGQLVASLDEPLGQQTVLRTCAASGSGRHASALAAGAGGRGEGGAR